jgi:hypothetical protein
MNRTRLWLWGSWFGLLILFAILWINRIPVYDWAVLRNYSPPADVSNLAINSGMNEQGKKLFYIGKPLLLDSQQFNKSCINTEQTKVLGCYVSYGISGLSQVAGIVAYNIYVYDINRPELEGIQEVTAAHEMLHAAYDRLSVSEKNRINELLVNYYNKSNNETLRKTIESYAARDPNVVSNELHSILATEIRSLPAELEQYYSNYFEDRDKVVDKYEAYEKVFSNNKAEIDKIIGELNLRKIEITKLEDILEVQNKQLQDIKSRMDSFSSSGNIGAYNSLVPEYNKLANIYNSEINELRQLLQEFNQLVEAHNSLIIVQQDLINSIDSNYQPL